VEHREFGFNDENEMSDDREHTLRKEKEKLILINDETLSEI